MKFRDLKVGDTFDWLNDAKPMYNSFYLRCTKMSARGYEDERGTQHKVGSVNAEVFHVEPKKTYCHVCQGSQTAQCPDVKAAQ